MKVELTVESNLSPVFGAFTEVNDLVHESSMEVKQFGKDSQAAYKNATSEVDKFGKEVQDGTKQTKELAKATGDVAKAGSKIKEIKQEIKNLTSEAIRAGEGTKTFTENLQKVGKLKDELNDINAAIRGVSGNLTENLAKAAGEATSLIATGFEAATAASALFGTKNEEVEKTLLKLQAVRSLANIAKEFGGIKDKLTEFKLALAPVAGLYTNANAALKSFSLAGKLNFKSLTEGGKGLFSAIGSGISNFVKAGVAGIKTLGATIAANPLGVILVVVAAIIGAMVLLRDKVKPIGDLFKAIGEIVSAVGDAIKDFAQSLGIVASDFEDNLQKQIDSVDKVTDAIGKRYDYEAKLAAAAGKDTEEIEKKKVLAQRRAIEQQIANLGALAHIQGTATKEQLEQLEKLFEKRTELIQEFNIASVKQATEEANKKKEADKKSQEDAKAHSEKLKQLRKELTDALLDLNKRAEQAELSQLSGKERVLKQKEIQEESLALLRKSIEDKGKLTNKNFKFTIEQEGEFAKLQIAINHEAADALLAIEVEKSNRLAAQRKKEFDDELAFLEMKEKIALAQVGSAKNDSGLPEAEFEKMKQRVIAQIKIKSAQEQQIAKKQAIQAEASLQITALENEIKVLSQKGDAESALKAEQAQKSIDAIKQRAQLEMQLLNATTEEEIKNLQDQINNIDKGLNKNKEFSLGKILGLDDESMGKMQAAIQQTIESLKELSDTYFSFQQEALDKELAANDERISTREQNIDDLKSRLAEEQALQEQGLANNVDRIKAELDAQNAAKDADLAKEKQIKAEKRKLAKQQLVIDTALQASQLVLAIAQLFAQGSSFWVGPVPVGLIVAGLSAVAMTASFIAGKKKAFDAVNSDSATFREGGYTGEVGVDEVAGEVHGREFVHTAEKTKRYRNLFEGIHKDNKPLIEKGLAELLQGTGVVIRNPDLPSQLSHMKDTAYHGEMRAYFKNDNSGVEDRIDKVEQKLSEMMKQQKNKTTYLQDGTIIIQEGNKTRVIKK